MRGKDWTGTVFEWLTIISKSDQRYGKTNKGEWLWWARCKCGNTRLIRPSEGKRGKAKSCGCMIRPQMLPKDWTGQKFNKLTFVRRTDKMKGSSYMWEVLCDCGNTNIAEPATVASGEVKDCGCEFRLKRVQGYARIYDPVISSARAIWRSRYHDGDLPFDLFFELSQMNCVYCRIPPDRSYNVSGTCAYSSAPNSLQKDGYFTYNGLDRIDSSKGHNIDNIVPCCWPCNRLKGKQTIKEWIGRALTIASFVQENNSASDSIALSEAVGVFLMKANALIRLATQRSEERERTSA